MEMITDEQIKSIREYLVKRGYVKKCNGFFTKDDVEVDINECDSIIEIVYYQIKHKDINICENDYIGLGEYGYHDVEDLDETFTEFETEVKIIKFITSELNKMNILHSSHSGKFDIGNIEINIIYTEQRKFSIEIGVRLSVTTSHPTLIDTIINQIQIIECKCNMDDFISKFKSFYEIYK